MSSPLRAVEIQVRNADFETVARGFGELRVAVDPGLYQIEYRAGPEVDEELVALRSGETFQRNDVRVDFPTPVPVEGTSTSRETYQRAVESLGRESTFPSVGNSGLVVFIRNMRRNSGIPVSLKRVNKWALLDASMNVVTNLNEAAHTDEAEEWLGFSARLPQGEYLLHVDRGATDAFEQPFWLSDAWLTGIFIPNLLSGPAPEMASIHMSRIGVGWKAFDQGSHAVIRAAELALAGLRERRQVLPREELMRLLNEEFQDPMLGIIGAHAILLSRQPDLNLFDIVMNSLRTLVPNHPDVLVLQRIGARSRERGAPESAPLVTLPPMLWASYRALLELEAEQPGVIAEGSLAELAATRLLHNGSWTAWESKPPQWIEDSLPRPRSDVLTKIFADLVGERVSVTSDSPLAWVLAWMSDRRAKTITGWRDELRALRLRDSAGRKVLRYLDELVQGFDVGDWEAFRSSLNISSISTSTGLPAAEVWRVAGKLANALRPDLFTAAARRDRLVDQPISAVQVPETPFSIDVLGRSICSTWEEATNNGGMAFDAIIVGAGMFGAYLAEKIYRSSNLRVLVLDAGCLLLTEHVQNLARIGLNTVRSVPAGPDNPTKHDSGKRIGLNAAHAVKVEFNEQDPGTRDWVWGNPWRSRVAFPGLAYCLGGRSLYWAGWAPRLTERDLAQWPAEVADYLSHAYSLVEREIGVDPVTDYTVASFSTKYLVSSRNC